MHQTMVPMPHLHCHLLSPPPSSVHFPECSSVQGLCKLDLPVVDIEGRAQGGGPGGGGGSRGRGGRGGEGWGGGGGMINSSPPPHSPAHLVSSILPSSASRSLRVTLRETESTFTHCRHIGHWKVGLATVPIRLTVLVARSDNCWTHI